MWMIANGFSSIPLWERQPTVRSNCVRFTFWSFQIRTQYIQWFMVLFFSHNANDVENVKYSENNSRYTHGYPMPLVLWIYLNVWFWPIASEATKIEVSWVANMTGICRSMTNKNRYTDRIKLYFFTHGVKSPLMGRQFFGVKWWLPIPASRCGSKEIGRPQTAGSIQILFGKSHPKVWGL